MADNSKGKRSMGRRSSILKQVLADLDVNVKGKKEIISRRSSKRVSFAETCDVKEFPRDSPQFLKGLGAKDADTSGDNSHLDVSDVGPNGPGLPDYDVFVPEKPAGTESSFMVDEGETTFVSGMTEPGGYLESTRVLDRLDGSIFSVNDNGLDISEIIQSEAVQGEKIVSREYLDSSSTKKALPSATMLPPRVVNPLSGTVDRGHGLVQQITPHLSSRLANCKASESHSHTVIPGRSVSDVHGMSADASVLDASCQSPPLSARDFLNKMKGLDSCKSIKMEQLKPKQTIVSHTYEENTIFFDDNDDDDGMELTKNLSFANASMPKISAKSFLSSLKRNRQLASETNTPFNTREQKRTETFEEKTIFFGNTDVTDDMDITRNLPLGLFGNGEEKLSAKSFLASLHGNQPFPTAASASVISSSKLKDTRIQTYEERCILMDNAIADNGKRSCISTAVFAPTTASSIGSVGDTPCVEEVQKEEKDMTMTMEMTACMDVGEGRLYHPSSTAPIHSSQWQQGPAHTVAGGSDQQVQNEADVAETMDLTCVDNTRPDLLQVEANSLLSVSSENSSRSNSRLRAALVDITAHYSSSASPSPPAAQQGNSTGITRTAFMSGENRSAFGPVTSLPDQGNTATASEAAVQQRGLMMPEVQGDTVTSTRKPMMPIDQSHKAAQVSLEHHDPTTVSVTSGLMTDLQCQSALDPIQDKGSEEETDNEISFRVLPVSNKAVISETILTSRAAENNATNKSESLKQTSAGVMHQTSRYQPENNEISSVSSSRDIHSVARCKPSPETSIVFSTEQTVANMSLTSSSIPLTQSKSKTQRNKSVVFSAEDTAANMSLTCADLQSKQHLEKKLVTNISFRSQETTTNMSFTCADSFSAKESLSYLGENRAGSNMFDEECTSPKNMFSAQKKYVSEETALDSKAMESGASSNKIEIMMQDADNSVLFKPEDNGPSSSRLTCSSMRDKGTMLPSADRSIAFRPEDTAANMSLTCADLKGRGTVLSSADRSLAFRPEDTAANMSLTCADLKGRGTVLSSADRSLAFRPEDTAANMSLTCADLKGKGTVLSSADRTIAFRPEDTAANMSLTCADLKGRGTVLSSADRSLAFRPEDTAANMSLTCADLKGKGTVLSSADRSLAFRPEDTAANMSLTCADLKGRGTVLSSADRSLAFRPDDTAANMSLTCAEMKPSQSASCKDINTAPSVISTCVRAVDEKDAKLCRSFDLNGKKRSVGAEETAGSKINLTCADLKGTHVDDDQKVNLSKAAENSGQSINPLTSSELNNSPHGNMFEGRISFKPDFPTQEEDRGQKDNTMCVREPTTLVELTGVLAQIRKRLEMQTSNGESDSIGKNDSVEHTTPKQPKTHELQAKTGSSRKLQFSMSAMNSELISTTPCTSETNALKRHLHGSDRLDNATNAKMLCLNSRRQGETLEKHEIGHFQQVIDSSEEVMEVDHQAGMSNVTSISPPSEIRDSEREISPPEKMNGTNGSISVSPDIMAEPMPAFFPAASSGGPSSTSVNMSTSMVHNTTGSSVSLGRSFLDKQINFSKDYSPSSFIKICEEFGIAPFMLKGRVCRHSSGDTRADIPCETLTDRLNLASINSQECSFKMDFFKKMASIVQREEASSDQLEQKAMKHVMELNLIAETKDSISVRQQVHRLLTAGRQQSQAVWKRSKAEMLQALTQHMKVHYQTAAQDMNDLTTSTETIVSAIKTAKECNERVQSEVSALQTQVDHRKQSTRHQRRHQLLQEGRAELASLQAQMEKAKNVGHRLEQQEAELQAEVGRVRQLSEDSQQLQRQVEQAHDSLSALCSVHCWRPLRVDEQCVSCLLLHDSVLLSVSMEGPRSLQQPITDITATSRLQDGSEMWAVLANRLTVDTLSASSRRLLHTFTTRAQLPQMLDEVTRVVENINSLCVEVKKAFLKYRVTSKGTQITTELWSTEKLRKVSLTTNIPVNYSTAQPLVWQVQIIMGNISEKQIEETIADVGGGQHHFTSVLQAVDSLLHH